MDQVALRGEAIALDEDLIMPGNSADCYYI